MKIQYIFLLSLLVFCLFSACKKDPVTGRKVTGQVLEFGTNVPIENAAIEIHSCRTANGLTSCQLEQSLLSDATGSFSTDFSIEDIARTAILTVSADKYFASTEYFLNPGRDNELEIVLDPHAWLQLKVKNIAPAEEFDKILLGASLSPIGQGNVELTGQDVDAQFDYKLLNGNKELSLFWWIYEEGILQENARDTIFIPAHDTLYYEINY